MRTFFSLLLSFALGLSSASGQTLNDYIEAAAAHSPLIGDYLNRREAESYELERLRALYTHSRLEATGDLLFVPIVTHDNGQTAFEWNAVNSSDYFGYDLGEQSSYLHAGIAWTQPLLGAARYREAKRQSELHLARFDHAICMERHQLERSVTEHYLLCLLDQWQRDYADSVAVVLTRQRDAVERLARVGLAKTSDVRLIDLQLATNAESRAAAQQSFATHLSDLHLLCGLDDTLRESLEDLTLNVAEERPAAGASSLFAEQYRLDSLQSMSDLRQYSLQYKPRLDFFAGAGLQTGDFTTLQRRVGWSAGLTFTWTLDDGHQLRQRKRQTRLNLATTALYRDYALRERESRLRQIKEELQRFDERAECLRKQLASTDEVLRMYEREMAAGQLSVLDYLTVLQDRVHSARQLRELHTNRQLAIAAFHYWNF